MLFNFICNGFEPIRTDQNQFNLNNLFDVTLRTLLFGADITSQPSASMQIFHMNWPLWFCSISHSKQTNQLQCSVCVPYFSIDETEEKKHTNTKRTCFCFLPAILRFFRDLCALMNSRKKSALLTNKAKSTVSSPKPTIFSNRFDFIPNLCKFRCDTYKGYERSYRHNLHKISSRFEFMVREHRLPMNKIGFGSKFSV